MATCLGQLNRIKINHLIHNILNSIVVSILPCTSLCDQWYIKL
jgi:hypothetical protein